MKHPWMPFYPDDFRIDTLELSAEEVGIYFTMICLCWARGGPLPGSEEDMRYMLNRSFAGGIHGRVYNRVVPKLLGKYFYCDEQGNWRQKRVEKELGKARKISETQAKHARKRWETSAKLLETSAKLQETFAKENAESLKSNEIQNATAMPITTQHTHKDLGTSPKSPPTSALRAFAERFYRAYPKHVDPRLAEKAFAAAVKRGADPEKIIAAAERFAEATRRAGTEKQFIKAPAVWLNAGAYDSEDLPAPVTPQARAGPEKPFEKRNPWFEMMENELKANGNDGQNAAYFGESAEDFSGETIELNASEFNIES